MNILSLVLILTVVNILPRILPVFFIGKFVLPDIFITFLNYIPIAALGVLIFPGILSAVETPLEGILGGIFAAILGIFRVSLFFVVVLSVSFIYLIMLIM